MSGAPDCYKCVHRRAIPGDCHSNCVNTSAHVTGHSHGIVHGWFWWPINFDPVWLISCDGFNPTDERAAVQRSV
jgi:hypothetical protein